MSLLQRLFRSTSAAAAAEMALVLPMLLILLYGSTELGRYFWSEHVLQKAVRDGAVYASRQQIDNFDCSAGTVSNAVRTSTETLVKTGALSGSTPLLPRWSDPATTFTMSVACVTSANGTTLGGIYTANQGLVPVLTVTAAVPFDDMFGGWVIPANLMLNAEQQATVAGA